MPDITSDQPESGATFPLSGLPLLNWLRTAGQFLFGEIPNGDDLLSFLRENGVSIGSQAFYQVRADVLYSNDQVESLRTPLSALAERNPDSLVPLGYTTVPTWESQSSEFMYRVALHGYDPETGDSTVEYMMIGSDRQYTFNEIIDLAGSYIPSGKTSKGNTIEAITLDAAFRIP